MTVAILMAAIIVIYAATSLYVRKATKYLEASDAPWDRLYEAAKRVISDSEMPQEMAVFSAAAVTCAGCGCLTRQVLWDAFRARLGFRRNAKVDAEPKMTTEQRKNFSAVVVNAIYYDSLRAPLSGFLLRKLVFPWLRAASEGLAPAKKRSVVQMTKASTTAIRHRAEGRKILVGT